MRIRNQLLLASVAVLTVACNTRRTEDPVMTGGRDAGPSTSPSGDDAASRDRSLVRVVNALPKPASVDVVGGDRVIISNAAYKAVTPYQEVTQNVANFQIVTAGTDSVLATNSEAMMDGDRYTIVAYADDEGEANVRVLRDELEPAAGKARLRLINAAAGVGSIDCAMRGEEKPIFDNVAQGNEAGYTDVTPTSGTFEVRAEDGTKPPVRLNNFKLEAGKAYTLVVTGSRNTRIEVLSFEDAIADTGTQLSKVP